MNCPNCKETKLLITERRGVEIDYCPDCRGVWLDRGELDKIIEQSKESGPRENSEYFREPAAPATPNYPERPHERLNQNYSSDSHSDARYKTKQKKSFLEELFD